MPALLTRGSSVFFSIIRPSHDPANSRYQCLLKHVIDTCKVNLRNNTGGLLQAQAVQQISIT
jgi:hypothetical protein